MNTHQAIKNIGPEHDALADKRSSEQYSGYCQEYKRHQSALNLIKQLHHMAKSVQKHRGMSMAILAGSPLFEGDFAILQTQVVRRLRLLEIFAADAGSLLTDRDRENLKSAWITICADWRDDDVIDNFEFHSHFIEQLHGMIGSLAKGLEIPLSALTSELFDLSVEREPDANYPKVIRRIELLNFLSRELPTMVEQVARIRGLATFAAAKGMIDAHHNSKLKFAIGCAREQNEKIRPQVERLASIIQALDLALIGIKDHELKLFFLLEMVERDFLQGNHISASSHQLFKITTDVIDVYLKVVEEGWNLVGQWQEEDLEYWLMNVGHVR